MPDPSGANAGAALATITLFSATPNAISVISDKFRRLLGIYFQKANVSNALAGKKSTVVTDIDTNGNGLIDMVGQNLGQTPVDWANAATRANELHTTALAPYYEIAANTLVTYGFINRGDEPKVGSMLPSLVEKLNDPNTPQSDKAAIKQALKDMNNRIIQANDRFNEATQQTTVLAEQTRSNFTEVNQMLTQQSQDLNTTKESVKALSGLLATTELKAINAQTGTEAVKSGLGALETNLKNLEIGLDEKQNAIYNLNATVQEKAQLTQNRVDAAAAAATAYTDQTAKTINATLQAQQETLNKNVSAATAESRAYTDTTYDTLQANLDTKIDALQTNVTKADNKINESLKNIQNDLAATNAEVGENAEAIKGIRAKGEEIIKNVTAVNNRVEQTNVEVDKVKENTANLAKLQSKTEKIQNEEVERRQKLDTALVLMSGVHVLNTCQQLNKNWDALCSADVVNTSDALTTIGSTILQMVATAGPAISAALYYSTGFNIEANDAALYTGAVAAVATAARLFACRYFRPGLPTLETLRVQVADILNKIDESSTSETTTALRKQLRSTTTLLDSVETVPSAMLSVSLCKHLMYDPTGNCLYMKTLSFKETGWSIKWLSETFWANLPYFGQDAYDRKFADVFIRLCAIQADMCVLMSGSTLEFTPEAYLYMAIGSGFGTTAGRPSFGGRCIQFPATGLGNLTLRDSGTCTVSVSYAETTGDTPTVKLLKKNVTTLQNILSRSTLSRDAKSVVAATVDAAAAAGAARGPRGAGSSAAASPGAASGAPARSSSVFPSEPTDDYVAAPGTFFMRRYDATAMVPLDDAAETLLRQVIRGRSFTYGDVLRHRTRFGPIMAGLPAVRGLGTAINCVVQVDATHIANDGYPLVAFYDGTSNVPMYLLYRDM